MPDISRSMFRIIVDSFAGYQVYPVVTHVFNGVTESEADEHMQAHAREDRFFARCARGSAELLGCFNRIRFRGWVEPGRRGHFY